MQNNYISDPPGDYGAFCTGYTAGGDAPKYNVRAIMEWLRNSNRGLKPGEMLSKDELKQFVVKNA